MADFRIVWNGQEVSRWMMEDEDVLSALESISSQVAASNSAEAARHMHTSMDNPAYKSEIRHLSRGATVAVVHSTNRIAAAIGRKHGLPHW